MTDREVLEWWDYAILSGYKNCVFGPVKDIAALGEVLNWHPRRIRSLD